MFAADQLRYQSNLASHQSFHLLKNKFGASTAFSEAEEAAWDAVGRAYRRSRLSESRAICWLVLFIVSGPTSVDSDRWIGGRVLQENALKHPHPGFRRRRRHLLEAELSAH